MPCAMSFFWCLILCFLFNVSFSCLLACFLLARSLHSYTSRLAPKGRALPFVARRLSRYAASCRPSARALMRTRATPPTHPRHAQHAALMTSTLLSKVLAAPNVKLFNATAGEWLGAA